MKVYTKFQCKRCEKTFGYWRGSGRPRFYCRPCVKLERQDANAFSTRWLRRGGGTAGRCGYEAQDF